MDYIPTQGRLGLLRSHVCVRAISKYQNAVVFVIVAFAHALIILEGLRQKITASELLSERVLYMIYLAPQSHKSLEELQKPKVSQLRPVWFEAPTIQFAEPDFASNFTHSDNTSYKLANKKAEQYRDIFDPRLREKLENLPLRVSKKLKIQHLGVGVTLEDIGGGLCIYGDALRKEGRKVKCGPDEGELMMQNVEKALADPLGIH